MLVLLLLLLLLTLRYILHLLDSFCCYCHCSAHAVADGGIAAAMLPTATTAACELWARDAFFSVMAWERKMPKMVSC
jgi:hypothetical protein